MEFNFYIPMKQITIYATILHSCLRETKSNNFMFHSFALKFLDYLVFYGLNHWGELKTKIVSPGTFVVIV